MVVNMALTQKEKKELDEKMSSILGTLNTYPSFKLVDICELIGWAYNVSTSKSIRSSLNRCLQGTGYVLRNCDSWSSHTCYTLRRPICLIKSWEIKKEKNLIYFYNELTKAYDVSYDFITKQFSIPNFITNNNVMFDNDLRRITRIDFSEYEWLFNYCTDMKKILSIVDSDHYDKNFTTCPKGYISYLTETNEELSYDNLKDYVLRMKYGVFGMNLYKNVNISLEQLDFLINNNLDKEFIKMCISSIKSGVFMDRYRIRDFIDDWRETCAMINSVYHIDTNKDFKANIKLMENIIDEQKNKALARQLQKLNFINGYSNDNYIIIVPQSQEEKANEGEQQHNCVGYYYDSSILRGENFIFFIRKKNTPTKSYITCRYNYSKDAVIEYRGFSNKTVTDDNALNFLSEVEKIIKANRNSLANNY